MILKRKKSIQYAVLSILTIALFLKTADCESPYDAAMQLLSKMKQANSAVVDLRCNFTMEITKNKKRLPTQRMIFRYKARPETIHLTFLEPHKGRKVLYVRGDKKMKVRPGGFWSFTTVKIDPNSERGMEGGIDPITAQGFPQIVSAVERLLKNSTGDPADSVAIEEKKLEGSRNCIQLTIHSGDLEKYELLVDSSTHFPVRIIKQIREGSAVYSYENIEMNPNMPESEFKL